jgi:hypothetical protein
MVHIRHMRVRMSHRCVLVGVRMWLPGRISIVVSVLVVDIVHMRMCMSERLMDMLVLVPFGQV